MLCNYTRGLYETWKFYISPSDKEKLKKSGLKFTFNSSLRLNENYFWITTSDSNYKYIAELAWNLTLEYKKRFHGNYNKTEYSYVIKYINYLEFLKENIPEEYLFKGIRNRPVTITLPPQNWFYSVSPKAFLKSQILTEEEKFEFVIQAHRKFYVTITSGFATWSEEIWPEWFPRTSEIKRKEIREEWKLKKKEEKTMSRQEKIRLQRKKSYFNLKEVSDLNYNVNSMDE
jgi:hypothetical protein